MNMSDKKDNDNEINHLSLILFRKKVKKKLT